METTDEEIDDFDQRLAARLESRAAQVSEGRGRLFREAARELRNGRNAGAVGVWLERELVLEAGVEAARRLTAVIGEI